MKTHLNTLFITLEDAYLKKNGAAIALRQASDTIAQRLTMIPSCTALDSLRGIEGDCAATYFAVFPHLITQPDFTFNGRSKRPPLFPSSTANNSPSPTSNKKKTAPPF